MNNSVGPLSWVENTLLCINLRIHCLSMLCESCVCVCACVSVSVCLC